MSSSALERNVARLFRQKAPVFGQLKATHASIIGGKPFSKASYGFLLQRVTRGLRSWSCSLAGILSFALKAFVECIRLQTLSRLALQQLQLDIHFLRQQLGT